MANIRPANLGDVDTLVKLGAVMHRESRFRHLTYSPQKVKDLIESLIDKPFGFSVVYEKDEIILGGLIGVNSSHWFSDDVVGNSIALFVEPSGRGGFIAAMMIKAFKEWSLARGALMVDMGVNTGVQTEMTEKLLMKLGAQHIGGIYSWGRDV